MRKKVISFCAMLLATSLAYLENVNAVRFDGTFEVNMPIEFIIDARDLDNPRVDFLNLKSDLRPDFKWIALPAVAVMFNPSNPSEPVVLLDIKKTALKMILRNPGLSARAGIRPEDYINAGVSEEDLQIARREEMRPEEISLLDQVFKDLVYGDSSKGLDHICDGGMDILKGGTKFGLGFAILMRKAAVVFAKFIHESISSRVDAETASDPNEQASIKARMNKVVAG